VLIDEWQLAGTDLLWTLKRIVDEDPTPGRFVLTGSVEPATHGPTYPLTGRAVNLVVYPMTVAELMGHGDEPSRFERMPAEPGPPAPPRCDRPFTLNRLFATGFPAARDQSDPSMFLEGYAALVSQRAGDEGRDAVRLLHTLKVLAVLSAQAVPDQRIWDSADINKATWKAYEDLLARVHLAAPVPAYSSNQLKRLTGYPKRFLTDTAMALALADADVEDLRREPARAGHYFEAFVAQQLRPHLAAPGDSLWHVRTAGGEHEIDLLDEHRHRRFAFEIKATMRPKAADILHLQWLRRELGDNLAASFVVHTGPDTYQLADDTWALPAAHL